MFYGGEGYRDGNVHSCVGNVDTVYNKKSLKQFVFYVVEQAIKKYCNSTDDLQIENLLSKLIKVMEGSSSSPFFKKRIHTLENDKKLNEIFKEMFKWAYEVKSIKFVHEIKKIVNLLYLHCGPTLFIKL